MNKHKNSETPDKDNPEWTAGDMARAVAFTGLPAGLQGKLRGRPKAAETKERITIRLSPGVLDAFRQTGTGWQTKIDAVLKDWVMAHQGKQPTTAKRAAVAKRATASKRVAVAKRPMAAKR
jgi:Uncharacterized protein conserved in bacteria